MVDCKALKARIRFDVEHFGTKTQGEAYRYDQVAAQLTELFIRLMDADRAVEASQRDSDHSILIKVAV